MNSLSFRSIAGRQPFTGSSQASQLRTFMLSKVPHIGAIKSSGLFRMASLEKQTCRQLTMFIALSLMFSLVPVVGSQIAAQNAKYGAVRDISMSSFILHLRHILHYRVTVRDVEVNGPIHMDGANTHIPRIHCAQSQSACRTMQALSKPDVKDPDIKVRRSHGTGGAERDIESCMVLGRRASTREWSMLDDTKLLSVEKSIENLISHGNLKLKRQLLSMEEVAEGKEDLSPVSHESVNGKPIQLLEGKASSGKDPLETESQTDAGIATSYSMLRGSSKFKGSHFAIGETREKVQIRNVVETLRKSGLFAAVAGVIEGMNLWMLPQFVTIFAPTDSAYQTVQHADIEQLDLFQYHTVVQRYAFSQLCAFSEGTLLYTMRPGYTVLVTEKQNPFKISLDGVYVIAPDLYLDETIAVHGINGIFNSTLYGRSFGGHIVPDVAPPPADGASPNVSGELAPVASPLALESGPNNDSASAGAGQRGRPVQQGVNPGNDNINTTFPYSPLESEVASDIDGSDDTVSARFGACYVAACALFCTFFILCW